MRTKKVMNARDAQQTLSDVLNKFVRGDVDKTTANTVANVVSKMTANAKAESDYNRSIGRLVKIPYLFIEGAELPTVVKE